MSRETETQEKLSELFNVTMNQHPPLCRKTTNSSRGEADCIVIHVCQTPRQSLHAGRKEQQWTYLKCFKYRRKEAKARTKGLCTILP